MRKCVRPNKQEEKRMMRPGAALSTGEHSRRRYDVRRQTVMCMGLAWLEASHASQSGREAERRTKKKKEKNNRVARAGKKTANNDPKHWRGSKVSMLKVSRFVKWLRGSQQGVQSTI